MNDRSEDVVASGSADAIQQSVRDAIERQRAQSVNALIERPALEDESDAPEEPPRLSEEAFGAVWRDTLAATPTSSRARTS